jgi:hypothetical protein
LELTMTLSPARAALAAHQTKLVAASVACDVARGPVLELADRIDAARTTLRNAESALAALQTAEAENFVDCGRNAKPADFTAKIAAASAEVERRNRALAALEAKMAELRRPLTDAELSAGIVASATEPLIASVIAETADDVLAEFVNAQAEADRKEAALRTLIAHCVGRQWYALAEKLNTRVHATQNSRPGAAWQSQRHPRWDQFATALATDATAVPVALS